MSLLELGVLELPPPVTLELAVGDPQGGERAAYLVRKRLCLGGEPIPDISALADRLGLFVVCESLGVQQPEGCTVEVQGAGAAVLNGSHPNGRQRFTLAHEVGHHVLQDPYSLDWSVLGDGEGERVVNAFAIHLLLPRDGVTARWNQLGADGHPPRSRAITIAAAFGVSWSATVAQLVRFGLLEHADQVSYRDAPPRRGDYEELGVSLPEPIG